MIILYSPPPHDGRAAGVSRPRKRPADVTQDGRRNPEIIIFYNIYIQYVVGKLN